MTAVVQLAAIAAGASPFAISAWLFAKGFKEESDGMEVLIGILLCLLGILTLILGFAAATDLK